MIYATHEPCMCFFFFLNLILLKERGLCDSRVNIIFVKPVDEYKPARRVTAHQRSDCILNSKFSEWTQDHYRESKM